MREKIKSFARELDTLEEKVGEYPTLPSLDEEYGAGILTIKGIIDKTANEIFLDYGEEFLREPVIYLVGAVWGEVEDRTLTATQKEIGKKIASVLETINGIFALGDTYEAQKFIIGYLIRGLVISKIAYMVETFRNRKEINLTDIEPLGNA